MLELEWLALGHLAKNGSPESLDALVSDRRTRILLEKTLPPASGPVQPTIRGRPACIVVWDCLSLLLRRLGRYRLLSLFCQGELEKRLVRALCFVAQERPTAEVSKTASVAVTGDSARRVLRAALSRSVRADEMHDLLGQCGSGRTVPILVPLMRHVRSLQVRTLPLSMLRTVLSPVDWERNWRSEASFLTESVLHELSRLCPDEEEDDKVVGTVARVRTTSDTVGDSTDSDTDGDGDGDVLVQMPARRQLEHLLMSKKTSPKKNVVRASGKAKQRTLPEFVPGFVSKKSPEIGQLDLAENKYNRRELSQLKHLVRCNRDAMPLTLAQKKQKEEEERIQRAKRREEELAAEAEVERQRAAVREMDAFIGMAFATQAPADLLAPSKNNKENNKENNKKDAKRPLPPTDVPPTATSYDVRAVCEDSTLARVIRKYGMPALQSESAAYLASRSEWCDPRGAFVSHVLQWTVHDWPEKRAAHLALLKKLPKARLTYRPVEFLSQLRTMILEETRAALDGDMRRVYRVTKLRPRGAPCPRMRSAADVRFCDAAHVCRDKLEHAADVVTLQLELPLATQAYACYDLLALTDRSLPQNVKRAVPVMIESIQEAQMTVRVHSRYKASIPDSVRILKVTSLTTALREISAIFDAPSTCFASSLMSSRVVAQMVPRKELPPLYRRNFGTSDTCREDDEILFDALSERALTVRKQGRRVRFSQLQQVSQEERYRVLRRGRNLVRRFEKRLRDHLPPHLHTPFVTDDHDDTVEVLCDDTKRRFHAEAKKLPKSLSLNESQRHVVRSVLRRRGVHLVQGPPGTGKSTTIVGVTAAFLARYPDKRVLVCAPSNAAADSLAAKFSQALSGLLQGCSPRELQDSQASSERVKTLLRASVEGKEMSVLAETVARVIARADVVRVGTRSAAAKEKVELADQLNLDVRTQQLVASGLFGKEAVVVRRALLTRADELQRLPGESNSRLAKRMKRVLAEREKLDAEVSQQRSLSAQSPVMDRLRQVLVQRARVVVTTLSGSGSSLLSQVPLPKYGEEKVRDLRAGVQDDSDSEDGGSDGGVQRHVSQAHIGDDFDRAGGHGSGTFSLLLVDEACQASEPSTWVPMRQVAGREARCVLVGDPKQLRATLLSSACCERGYQVSLFERLVRYGESKVHELDDKSEREEAKLLESKALFHASLLDTQYRMRPIISAFPSRTFYRGRLKDAACVHRTDHWSDLIACNGILPASAVFLDVKGSSSRDGQSTSMLNKQEAHCVMRVVELAHTVATGDAAALARLRGAVAAGIGGVTETPAHFARSVGIIATYRDQVREIQSRLQRSPGDISLRQVETSTVDAFQGREKDMIVLSCVRAGDSRGIGFLSDMGRLNVALTRARNVLVVVGDADALARKHSTWRRLVESLPVLSVGRSCQQIDAFFQQQYDTVQQHWEAVSQRIKKPKVWTKPSQEPAEGRRFKPTLKRTKSSQQSGRPKKKVEKAPLPAALVEAAPKPKPTPKNNNKNSKSKKKNHSLKNKNKQNKNRRNNNNKNNNAATRGRVPSVRDRPPPPKRARSTATIGVPFARPPPAQSPPAS